MIEKNTELSAHSLKQNEENQAQRETYLVFAVNNGLYAAPLLSVREVVEFKTPKPIPHTQDFFLGVTNIRGEIVGVLDLSRRLSGEFCNEERRSMLVVSVDNCSLAVVVNSVNQVVELLPSEIEKRNPAHTTENAYIGIAKVNGELVTILNLSQTIQEKEFTQVKELSLQSDKQPEAQIMIDLQNKKEVA